MYNGTQEQKILDLINSKGYTTTLEIVKLLNVTSPTKAISNLRKKGFPIIDRWMTSERYDGRTVRYKAYSLEV